MFPKGSACRLETEFVKQLVSHELQGTERACCCPMSLIAIKDIIVIHCIICPYGPILALRPSEHHCACVFTEKEGPGLWYTQLSHHRQQAGPLGRSSKGRRLDVLWGNLCPENLLEWTISIPKHTKCATTAGICMS